MLEQKKLADLTAKTEEYRLRTDIKIRDISQGKGVISAGLFPRVSRLEATAIELAYRLVTVEEQMVWTDQKIRAVWLATNAPATEAILHVASVRTIWGAAANALTQRLNNAPFTPTDPRNPSNSRDSQQPGTSNQPTDDSSTKVNGSPDNAANENPTVRFQIISTSEPTIRPSVAL